MVIAYVAPVTVATLQIYADHPESYENVKADFLAKLTSI